jgi:hypothetical protein
MIVDTGLTAFNIRDLIKYAERKRRSTTRDSTYWGFVKAELESLLAQVNSGGPMIKPTPRIVTQGSKVIVSSAAVAVFNLGWPGSTLRSTRSYWFDFAPDGDLQDTDVPEQDDGSAAAAMADDCKAYFMDGYEAEWMK